ncbi:hypothetical protein [Sorangium cellulosum]|uniref:dioxygenase family protein n=1 Tax=Sorangium cellulosum TaxID=56 RepID=UPI0009B8E2AC|nr:hypothetical protein [Sorangium cellulosum]
MECRSTDETTEGPFYRPHAPDRTDLYPPGSTGPVLWFTGTVADTRCCSIPHVEIEVWHADSKGLYDSNDPIAPQSPAHFRCRGRMTTDSQGRFELRTEIPGNYPVATQSWVRVKHIHFKLFAPGHRSLTTQIFLLPDDHTSSDRLYNPRLAVQLERGSSQAGREGAFSARFDFVLEPASDAAYALPEATVSARS